MSDLKRHKKSGECIRNLKSWVPGSGTSRVSKIRGCVPGTPATNANASNAI